MVEQPGVVLTRGVHSTVYAYNDLGEPAGRYGRYGAGHVALFDHDDHEDPGSIFQLFAEECILGPTYIFESSEGQYHSLNMKLRGFHKTCKTLKVGNDDWKHTDIGFERGWWRLRVGPKLTANDDMYKPDPSFVDSFMIGTDMRVSSPHIELISKLHDDVEHPDGLFACERYGDMVETIAYATYTDEEKAIQRRIKLQNAE